MISLKKKISKIEILSVFLVLFFALEAINKIQTNIWGLDFDLQKYVKLGTMLYMLSALVFEDKRKISLLAGIVIIYGIGQFFLAESFKWLSLVGFSRYLFFLTTVMFFSSYPVDEKSSKPFKIFQLLIFINSVIVIIAYLFQLEIFKSYSGSRWGYNGLFMASATSSYVYIIAFISFLFYYQHTIIRQLKFWIVLLAALFTGTKSIYISIIFLSVLATFLFSKNKKIKFTILFSLIASGSFLLVWFFNNDLFSGIIKNDGLLTAVLSYRDQLFLEDTLPYIRENWSLANYFFGGLSDPFLRPQLEIIDLFVFFGFVGATYFLWLFLCYYFNFSIINQWFLPLIIFPFLVSFITGNFFYNASIPIYLVALKTTFIRSQNNLLLIR